MLKTNKKGSLIVVSGPSGAGKDSAVGELLKINSNIYLSISATTRPPRGNEQDGIDYFFLTKEEFEEKIKDDEFLEYAIYNDNYYGTPKTNVEKKLSDGLDVILIIEVQGALKIKNLIPEALFVFIVPPSMEELKERLYKRGTDAKNKIFERFKTAYKEINEVSKYNYVVVCDYAKNAAEKINAILISEKCRVDRIEEIDLNNREELMHEILVDLEK